MTATFDKETLLDLVVNVIPLAIMLLFAVGFVVYDPFGGDRLGRLLQFGLLAFPFVALAILTYLSGKAIAGDEKRGPVYPPGQATVDGIEPSEGHDDSPSLPEGDVE
jgi:hypothetical protein